MIARWSITLLIAAGISAAASTASATSNTAPTEKPKQKKICKTDTSVTGTRIAKRICKTEEEWAVKEDGQNLTVKGRAGNPVPICSTC
jgi:tellurite resistance protein